MSRKVVSISLPEHMIARIDSAAYESFATRSDFIRQAITDSLRTADGYRARTAEIRHGR